MHQTPAGTESKVYNDGNDGDVDPRVADFFMMSSPWASLIICVLYVIAVEWALPRFMQDRKPLEFRPLIVVYNFAMVLLSGYIFLEVCKQQFLAVLDFTEMISSVVTVSKCFLSVGFGRFCRKNLGFRFGLGFHDKCIVNFFMTRVIRHDFHHR